MTVMTECASRRADLVARFSELKIDGLFVSSLPNVRYLTGFTGSNGLLLLTPDRATFFTDPRYTLQAAREVDCRVRAATGPALPRVAAQAAKKKIRRLGFERGRISFDTHDALRSLLPLGAALRPVAGQVERLRMRKSPAEIETIRAAVAINSEAFEQGIRAITPNMTESGLAAEIEYRMRHLGADKPSFETIVAAGERSALPHASPGSSPLGGGLVLIDMGATLRGYSSDMTRMLFLGRPGRRVKELYKAVLEAQLAAIDAVRPGVSAGSVDRAARRVLAKHGLDKAFLHSTGHGLGLEIHEPPRLGKREKTLLETGMAITIEPGAYIEGFGGVRIEDTVVVTASGCEILTPTPKALRVSSC
jgi:Xaa-Pro aminopeptidase